MAAASSSKGRINWADDDFDGPDISFAGLSLGAQISKKDDKKTQADTKPEPASVVKTDPRPKADDAESKPAAGAKEQEGENEEEEEEKEKEVIEAPDFAPEPEIKRPDGFPELKSWKRFEDGNFKAEIYQALDGVGFKEPSMIQKCTLPYLLAKSHPNLIVQSQSGSGKTAAFCLNILQRVDPSIASPQAIVLSPTRELAIQTCGVMQSLGSHIAGLKVSLILGKRAGEAPPTVKVNRKSVASSPDLDGHILVGTSQTILRSIRGRTLNVKKMKVLVLDEADSMLDQVGQGQVCQQIKMECFKAVKESLQITLFSATFPTKVLDYAGSFAPQAVVMTLAVDQQAVAKIVQMSMEVKEEDKVDTLVQFCGWRVLSACIVFVQTRAESVKVYEALVNANNSVGLINSDLRSEERQDVLERFVSGKVKFLVGTDVISRGIDANVSLVINYEIPVQYQSGVPDSVAYIHRIGRTGRFGASGIALSLVTSKTRSRLDAISKKLAVTIQAHKPADVDEVRDIAELVERKIDELKMADAEEKAKEAKKKMGAEKLVEAEKPVEAEKKVEAEKTVEAKGPEKRRVDP